MNRRSPLLIIVALAALALLGAGAYLWYARQATQVASEVSQPSAAPAPQAQPTAAPPTPPPSPAPSAAPTAEPAAAMVPEGVVPTVITTFPTSAVASLFANPDQPAYVEGQGFAPDAQRVLDIVTLEIGLEKYRAANSRYPGALADLFPSYAPIADGRPLAAPPVDPETHQPYEYAVLADGAGYQLAATLSSGKKYSAKK